MEIARTYTFEAAHTLPNLPEGHKCGRLHGHSYRVTVWVDSDLELDGRGFAGFDFAEIDQAWQEQVHCNLDHSYLNDTLQNPTAEIVAQWIHEQMETALGGPVSIELQEGPRSKVRFP